MALYAASTNAFYVREIHGENIPADAVEITQEEYRAAFAGQRQGQEIVPGDNGKPALRDVAPAVPAQITFAQLLIGLVAEGWITEAEGDAWLEGRIPAAARTLIGTLPQAQRFAAKARAARPSIVLRNDPLVTALATAQGRADELDRFFTTYAAV